MSTLPLRLRTPEEELTQSLKRELEHAYLLLTIEARRSGGQLKFSKMEMKTATVDLTVCSSLDGDMVIAPAEDA